MAKHVHARRDSRRHKPTEVLHPDPRPTAIRAALTWRVFPLLRDDHGFWGER